jgi:TolB-like protein
MGEDEAGTLQTLKGHHREMSSLVEKHHGRVVDTRGDNLLAEFASVVGGLVVKKYLDRPPSPPVATASAQKAALPLPDKPSVAVLPFENMTGDPRQEYFADGFTEQIITSLSKIPALFVISRNSTFTYKGKPVKVQQVGEELGVRYVLEGSVQKSSGRIRINVQLIDPPQGVHNEGHRINPKGPDHERLAGRGAQQVGHALLVERAI